MRKINRVGEVNISNEGYEMKIIKYINNKDIWIEFQDEYKTRLHIEYKEFQNGKVKNPYHRSVFNVGYIGQGEYKTKKNGKDILAYKYWTDMLRRCYDPYFLNKNLSYINCCVCDEWLCYQTFAKWFYENYYECNDERMHLDKDILIKGNKIYSSNTCIFVPQRINSLFVKQKEKRGEYPIGVNYHKQHNKLVVRISYLDKDNKVKRLHLGYFPIDKPFQAFVTYKISKEKYIKQIADDYKNLIPLKLYMALYQYEIEIND